MLIQYVDESLWSWSCRVLIIETGIVVTSSQTTSGSKVEEIYGAQEQRCAAVGSRLMGGPEPHNGEQLGFSWMSVAMMAPAAAVNKPSVLSCLSCCKPLPLLAAATAMWV